MSNEDIWFPAKRYGWGWGFPVAWQGWLFMLAWIGALIIGVFYIRPETHTQLAFYAFVLMMVILLIGVCYWKGEKPGWRWGK